MFPDFVAAADKVFNIRMATSGSGEAVGAEMRWVQISSQCCRYLAFGDTGGEKGNQGMA